MRINLLKICSTLWLASFCFVSPAKADLDHFIEARRLLEEEAIFLNATLGMKIFGCGGSFVDNIEALELIVEVPNRIDWSAARAIFTAALQDWINRVNADQQAMPYYKNYPMTVENFELRMLLKEFNIRSSEACPIPTFIFNIGDKIIYCFRNENGSLRPFLRESFNKVLQEIACKKAAGRVS